ncbi:MAG: hypothetical protein WAV16_02550 [Candidatus Moraniibacteriota bacterium]
MNTQKVVKLEIEDGPNREGLFDSLRLGLIVNFKFKKVKEVICFNVDSIGNAESSRTTWRIEVTRVASEGDYLPMFMAGWYDTKNRKGLLEADHIEACRLKNDKK